MRGQYDSPGRLLEAAIAALDAAGVKVVRRSSWWRSQAWPDPSDPAYVNGVAVVETTLSPLALLTVLHEVERVFGRDRHAANAPRTLDLDLIAHGRTISAHPALPHPRAHDRRFVMGPLAEVAPGWVHPRLGRSAAALLAEASVGADAAPVHN